MLENEHPYDFESGGGLRGSQAAKVYLRALEARLGFRDEFPADIFENRLRDFVINCHLSIAWYERKIKRELKWRWGYFVVSLGLLALIPIALWLATKYLPEGTDTATKFGAILTGLLAFYRGISAWLDKRQVVAGYSKAMSDLKDLLYTFEQKWDGAATVPEREEEFTQAIKDAIARSRAIVRLETQEYFSTLAYPTLDIDDILNTSGQQAKSLIAQFGSVRQVPAPVAASQDPRVAQLRALVDDYNAQIEAALSQGADQATVAELRRMLREAVTQLRTAQLGMAPQPV
ncbi:hypothetical protein [Dongia sedimenti]|uniref:SMODS and SLOG-associating 2TM effector domain-containing protein n=1 Tax=Dongia sedimenti TaxID=3064282 RepID=A0ABU0YN64_9PROT|nr:hypothetical protein [Rhodospirillaceae bacterium R-7]